MTPRVYLQETTLELRSILRYWMENTQDEANGGFWGRLDENDKPDKEAPKGVVLNSRILWAFSAAYRNTQEWIYLPIAERAWRYLTNKFIDGEYGGAFWSLDVHGRPLSTRRQLYGIAFTIYSLSEYALAAGNEVALKQAVSLYQDTEAHGADPIHGGYIEALSQDWKPLQDRRLSDKDLNSEKTTNTHLHILEAYASLYRAWPDPTLANRIENILGLFEEKMIDPQNHHLKLFFDAQWNSESSLISYGHDIEAAWLLYDAATTINNPGWIKKTAALCLKMAAAAAEGRDQQGGLWNEKDDRKEKHWWPQAEAMVGFLYAWKLSGDDKWYRYSVEAWAFVKNHIRDPAGKEWYWGVDKDNQPMPGQDKAGFWKCPYHNSRACLRIMDILT